LTAAESAFPATRQTIRFPQLKKGQKARLYTYLHVREDIFDLYGFATQNELASFKMLIGISGVGPKAALAILSVSTPETLAMAIITGDEKSTDRGAGHRQAHRPAHHPGAEGQAQRRSRPPAGVEPDRAACPRRRIFQQGHGGRRGALAVLGYSTQEVSTAALKGVDVEGLPRWRRSSARA
jgi:Holliday junction DNA helicase RuvA